MRKLEDDESFKVIGAAMEVHRELGPGFLEHVYHEALEFEFTERNIPYKHEVDLPIWYKGRLLRKTYRVDFVCYDSLLVEIKALSQIGNIETSKVINYLKATNFDRALLVNFGAASLQYKRKVNKWKRSEKSAQSA